MKKIEWSVQKTNEDNYFPNFPISIIGSDIQESIRSLSAGRYLSKHRSIYSFENIQAPYKYESVNGEMLEVQFKTVLNEINQILHSDSQNQSFEKNPQTVGKKENVFQFQAKNDTRSFFFYI
jgi:hypothetical protein